MKQIWQTLVFAASNIFKLGFFKLNPSSKEHYFGLRSIKNRPGKVVKNPINGLFGVLILALSSKFKITSSAGELPLLSSHHRRNDSNPSASLLPSTNLVPWEVNPNETAAYDSRQLIEYCKLFMVSTPEEEVDSNNNTNADDVGGSGPSCWSEGKNFDRKIGLLNLSHLKPRFFCDPSMSHTECEGMCRANCGCDVYAAVYDDDTGCVYWVGKIDFIERNFAGIYYIRNSSNSSDNSNTTEGREPSPAPTQLPNTFDPYGTTTEHGKESNITRWWWVLFLVAILAVFLHRSLHYLRAKSLEAPKRQDDFQKENASKEMSSLEMGTWIKSSHRHISADKLEKGEKLGDFYSFSYASILAATDNFSPTNKLGEGGFGPVYKGIVPNGQEIAVKKLSTRSSQGLVEFKNEIMLIAKLQHTNLVRLLGFCMQGKEKLLVYEFMSNNSLDSFLFDPTKREILNWKKRRVIIEGIAQGLLYLHKYSRLKVIHRDLKPSNILLDNDMNPKISDFGIARMFDRNESKASTNRIVGTYGYMSPEYAMEGIFSEKSDVFSFGVIVAEIISGKRNTSFSNMDCPLNLIGYAWGLWKEGKSSELIDQTMSDSCSRNELQRCIQVALLCVQDSPTDRPTMSDVVSLLTNENTPLPTPNKPAFCFGRSERELDFNKHKSQNCSLNFVTISTLEAR